VQLPFLDTSYDVTNSRYAPISEAALKKAFFTANAYSRATSDIDAHKGVLNLGFWG